MFESRYSYIGHCSSHNRGEEYKKGRKKNLKQKDLIKKCLYCEREFESGLKLGGHQSHCILNPNKKITSLKLSKINKGKKLSQEHKDRISEGRKKFLDNNPGNIPYLLNHSSKESYPERIFRERLVREGIIGWEQEYPFKRYSMDFAFIDKKIDVEIDGGTHNLEKVIMIDREKERITSKDGWVTIRFSDSEIKNEMDSCIIKLKHLLFPCGKQV
jgi:very-short-patch-repair endonuclease